MPAMMPAIAAAPARRPVPGLTSKAASPASAAARPTRVGAGCQTDDAERQTVAERPSAAPAAARPPPVDSGCQTDMKGELREPNSRGFYTARLVNHGFGDARLGVRV